MLFIAIALGAAILLHCVAGLAAVRAPAQAGGPRWLMRVSLTVGLLAASAGLFLPNARFVLLSVPFHGNEYALGLGLHLDRLSLLMVLCIAAIGGIAQRFAWVSLVGDGGRNCFQGWLALTTAAALVQAVSVGLVQFALGWMAVSVGINHLLLHHGDRPAAVLAARSKFVVSRMGDAAMLLAIVLLLTGLGTTDLVGMQATLMTEQYSAAILLAAALALAVAVICKTALVPFQHWLIGTVEAPTALSALMHAGIVNAGGFLIIRCSGLFAAADGALNLVLFAGLISAVVGPLVMWSQTDLKRSLAWSTVGQMGFLLIQCGLGAFGAAFLHLVGHGCYKANAFLRSGNLQHAVEQRPLPGSAPLALLSWTAGVLIAVGVLTMTSFIWSGSALPLHGGLVLILVQGLAMGQLLGSPVAGTVSMTLRVGVLVVASGLYGSLTYGAEHLLTGITTLAPLVSDRGVIGIVLSVLVPLALAGLGAWWVLLPTLELWPALRAWRIHAGAGFYLPHLTARLLQPRASAPH